jgi:hypothetical protein
LIETIKIQAHITGKFRDNACVEQTTKAGEKDRLYKKKAQKTKSRAFWHHYDSSEDINSWHCIYVGSLQYGYSMILNPC